jgi:cytochrome c biogenesis protein CcdA
MGISTFGGYKMLKKTIYFISLIILSTILFFSIKINIYANDHIDYDVVYFGSYSCSVCQDLESSGVLDDLVTRGLRLKKYMAEDDYQLFESMFVKYAKTFKVPQNLNLVPIIYVGDTFFVGYSSIHSAINNGLVEQIAQDKNLLELKEFIYLDLTLNDLLSLIGSTIVLGFLDAFNPCALAMLIMFLSFLTDKKFTKSIALICLSYIFAVFVTYFMLGILLASVLTLIQPFIKVFYFIIILLALFVSILNFMDFFAVRNKDYVNVKNQLPKKVFTVTKKIMSNFATKIENGNKSIYALAFLIGVFVAFIEFPCSGQAFVAWTAIVVDRTTQQLVFYTLLFFYVLLFVSPLIIISIVGLKSQNVPVISNFIRTKLDVIKLANAIVFLAVALYYIIRLF